MIVRFFLAEILMKILSNVWHIEYFQNVPHYFLIVLLQMGQTDALLQSQNRTNNLKFIKMKTSKSGILSQVFFKVVFLGLTIINVNSNPMINNKCVET